MLDGYDAVWREPGVDSFFFLSFFLPFPPPAEVWVGGMGVIEVLIVVGWIVCIDRYGTSSHYWTYCTMSYRIVRGIIFDTAWPSLVSFRRSYICFPPPLPSPYPHLP